MLKKIIVFLTSLLLILNSTLSNAFAIRQWGVNNPMAVRASILYDGLKGAVTSSVLITPNATQVAKVLGTGGAGFALSYAVEQLLGAVDWVLDPANNQIKYKEKNPDHPPFIYKVSDYGAGNSEYDAIISYFKWLNKNNYGFQGATVTSYAPCTVCNGNGSWFYWANREVRYVTVTYSISDTTQTTNILVTKAVNPIIEKTLPLETVAQKVIENAESDNLDAQFAVLAAANNILSEAEQDDAKAKPIEDELERNAKKPPCITVSGKVVAVGTYGYRHDKVPPSKPHYPFTGDHYNLYKANQNPNNGKCFWVESGAADASNGQLPPPNSIPIEPFI